MPGAARNFTAHDGRYGRFHVPAVIFAGVSDFCFFFPRADLGLTSRGSFAFVKRWEIVWGISAFIGLQRVALIVVANVQLIDASRLSPGGCIWNGDLKFGASGLLE